MSDDSGPPVKGLPSYTTPKPAHWVEAEAEEISIDEFLAEIGAEDSELPPPPLGFMWESSLAFMGPPLECVSPAYGGTLAMSIFDPKNPDKKAQARFRKMLRESSRIKFLMPIRGASAATPKVSTAAAESAWERKSVAMHEEQRRLYGAEETAAASARNPRTHSSFVFATGRDPDDDNPKPMRATGLTRA